MISKNNSFDAGTIRVSKSIKDEDKQLSNFDSNRKQKKESQPEFMRMMDKIKMFDNDFGNFEDEVAKAGSRDAWVRQRYDTFETWLTRVALANETILEAARVLEESRHPQER
jgi:hypothetical protein